MNKTHVSERSCPTQRPGLSNEEGTSAPAGLFGRPYLNWRLSERSNDLSVGSFGKGLQGLGAQVPEHAKLQVEPRGQG